MRYQLLIMCHIFYLFILYIPLFAHIRIPQKKCKVKTILKQARNIRISWAGDDFTSPPHLGPQVASQRPQNDNYGVGNPWRFGDRVWGGWSFEKGGIFAEMCWPRVHPLKPQFFPKGPDLSSLKTSCNSRRTSNLIQKLATLPRVFICLFCASSHVQVTYL